MIILILLAAVGLSIVMTLAWAYQRRVGNAGWVDVFWTAGLGLEYCLWGNVFMRGEWEYVRFMSVENTTVTMNSARAGIGYKF